MRESLKALKQIVGTKPITAIEIGVLQGENAMDIYNNFTIDKLYLVDGWMKKYTDNAIDNLSITADLFDKYIKKVTIIKALSPAVADIFPCDYFDYIYLDDNHNPDHVYSELDTFMPLLKNGGMIAGHDWNDELPERVQQGVNKYCTEQCREVNFKQNENEAVGDWWIIK